MLDTDRATVSATISERAVVELPLSGRNVWSLASTTPGVLGGLNSDIGLSFRGAGQREIQNSLSLDGINSSANLLAATSMRPIADAVTEVQVQTGSTSAEYGAYLGVARQRGDQERHQQACTARCSTSSRTTPSTRAATSTTARCPRTRASGSSSARSWTAPCMIPGLYNGKNRTFFMVAYEGVRADAITSPIASVPTALMRQGNFSEVTTPIRDPRTGAAVPGQHHPARRMLSPTSLQLLQYYPDAEPGGHAPTTTRARARPTTTSTSSSGASTRTSATRCA